MRTLSAERIELIDALVASPAGNEFEKYPLKFVVPAYFGTRPQTEALARVNSLSASLLRLNGFDSICI